MKRCILAGAVYSELVKCVVEMYRKLYALSRPMVGATGCAERIGESLRAAAHSEGRNWRRGKARRVVAIQI